MAKLKFDLKGKRFGKYIVLRRSDIKNSKCVKWLCQCDCGVKKNIDSHDLKRGKRTQCRSCGNKYRILKKERKPDKGKISEYRMWAQMKVRCLNPKHKMFKNYGGRGIKIYDPWIHSYEEFFAYVGKRPSKELSLDRINNDGNYEPGNLRWATPRMQVLNRRKFKRTKKRKLT